ncbi:hypothetical protein Tco_0697307 [Tanacetum coccineum]
MHENKSFNKNPANHRLYHALMKALIEDENAMDKGVADTVKDHKRKHDDDDDDIDDEDRLAGQNQGKKTKRRRTKELESSKKPSTTKENPKEPIAEVVMDDAGENVVHDDDQPQDTSKPKETTTPNPEWFKQPPRPPTPDPEWNKCQVVLGQDESIALPPREEMAWIDSIEGIKQTERGERIDSESSKKPSSTKETPKGKAQSKGSKIGKFASAKEPIKEPIAEVVMDDAGEDVQPPRPPTPDPEWNKRQVVLGQPKQPWFNQMVSATKDPLTFNDLMATPVDFSKYVLNRLKIDSLTQDLLLGPAYDLLKGTCTCNIELEYNFQECFNALTDKLDWNNPEGDRYPFDLSKPLPLQGCPGHLTVAVDYFFNNDLEYLKSSDPERTYTTSITKTKAARYEIVGIEDMVPTLWSTIKHAYDKDAAKGIKH